MRILIAEDNPVLLKQLVRALREQSYAVDTSQDGEEAIYKLENWPFDLAILDIMMPKLDGLEVLQKLRETRNTPVILLTARDAINDRVRGLDLGADDYLSKPFEMSELLARVRSILRRSKNISTPNLKLGDVEIDTNASKVSRLGQEISLTSMEYAICLNLGMNANKIISSQDLLDAVLDENDDSLSNSLNVHIFNIRKKLGKDFIKTIRGRGFSIDSK